MKEPRLSDNAFSEKLKKLTTLQQEIKVIFQKRPLKDLQPKSQVYEAMDFILNKLAEISLLLKLVTSYVEAVDQNRISKEEQEEILSEVGRAIRISSQMIAAKLRLKSKDTLFICTHPDIQMFKKDKTMLDEIVAGVYLHKREDQSVTVYLVSDEVGADTTKFFLIPAKTADLMLSNIQWPGNSSKMSYAMIEDKECKEIIFDTLPLINSCEKVISELKSASTIESVINSELRQICKKCYFIENDILEKQLSSDEQDQINKDLYWGVVNEAPYSNIFSIITLNTISWGVFSVKRDFFASLYINAKHLEYINQMRMVLDPDFRDTLAEIKKNAYKVIRLLNKGSWSKPPAIPKNIMAAKTIYLYRDSRKEEIIYAIILHEKNKKDLLKVNEITHFNKEYASIFKTILWDNAEIIEAAHLQDRIISHVSKTKSQPAPKEFISENISKANVVKRDQNSQKQSQQAVSEEIKINELKSDYSYIQRAFEVSRRKVEEYQANLSKVKMELRSVSSLENKMVEKINNIKEPPVVHFTNFERKLNKILSSIEGLQNSKESKNMELIETLKSEMNELKESLVNISEEFMAKMIYLDDCYATYKNRESSLKQRLMQSKVDSSMQKEKKPQPQAILKANPSEKIVGNNTNSNEKTKNILTKTSSVAVSVTVKDKVSEVRPEEKLPMKVNSVKNINNNNEEAINLPESKIEYIEKTAKLPTLKNNQQIFMPSPKEDLVDTLYLQISAQTEEIRKEKTLKLTGVDLDISRACLSYLVVRFLTVLYEKNKNKNELDYKSLKVYRYLRNSLLKCIFVKNNFDEIILDSNIFNTLAETIKQGFEGIHKAYKTNGELNYSEISNFCFSIKQKFGYKFDQAWTVYQEKEVFDHQDIQDIISCLKKIQDIVKPIPHDDVLTLRNEPNRLMAVKFFLTGISQIYKDHIKDNLSLSTMPTIDKVKLEQFMSKITNYCRNETGHNTFTYHEVGEDIIFKINSQIDNILPTLRGLKSHQPNLDSAKPLAI